MQKLPRSELLHCAENTSLSLAFTRRSLHPSSPKRLKLSITSLQAWAAPPCLGSPSNYVFVCHILLEESHHSHPQFLKEGWGGKAVAFFLLPPYGKNFECSRDSVSGPDSVFKFMRCKTTETSSRKYTF